MSYNIDINFKEVHLIDNRVSKEDAYKYIEKTDIVINLYLMMKYLILKNI